MIELHYSATPNGQKIALALLELELPYRVVAYDIFEGDHLTPEFARVNPNHKLPAIVDLEPADGGAPFAVFESGAVLQYLAEKTGRLIPKDLRGRSLAIQWLTWQMAGLGPMGGQASHFVRYAPPGNDYAIQRYTKESQRLLTVLENRLSEADYLAGEEYSIADIAVWPGRYVGAKMGMNRGDYPATQRWVDRIAERPAALKAIEAPEFKAPAKYLGMKQALSPAEWSNMFGDRMLGAVKRS
ncbi:Disulfide-bond oxidoreductase YfcG [Alphaproteobacteria bacterium SO-S41]|nr:Disulfide-bond oxidoreductase YfcG [Alphaproteobacteria bacterium SO-S41]